MLPLRKGREGGSVVLVSTGCPPGAFQRLELYAGKLARTVLRGVRGGNPTGLPGAEPLRKLFRLTNKKFDNLFTVLQKVFALNVKIITVPFNPEKEVFPDEM